MRVLLSIKPEHVENIFNGTKTYEFRRRMFTRRDIKAVVIYSTMPVGKIVGEFDIERILSAPPNDLWKLTAAGSGITRSYYDAYFEGRERAFALAIGAVRVYDVAVSPKEIAADFKPPQSYMYVDDGVGVDWLQSRQRELFLV
jgi:predicted transcriptional regulator